METTQISATNRNPGIVPPWLANPKNTDRNPGIVPPWLTDPITILPVDDFTILPVETATAFVPTNNDVTPMTFVEAIRAR